MKPIGSSFRIMKLLTKNQFMKLEKDICFLMIFYLYFWLLVTTNAENLSGNLIKISQAIVLCSAGSFFFVWKNYHVSIVFKKSCFFNSPAISYDFIQSHFFYRWWIFYFTRRYKQTFSILYSGGRNWYWNVFFKDLSKKDVNVFVQSKCLRWDQFFVNSTDLNNHNFLLPIR